MYTVPNVGIPIWLIMLLVGFTIMLAFRQTRLIGLLLLGLFCLLLFSHKTMSVRNWQQNDWQPATVSVTSTPIEPAIPLPPGYTVPLPAGYTVPQPQASISEASQSAPAAAQPNGKQAIQAYESAISYYTKALALPLKLEKQEILPDKISTIKISIQDLGQVTVSGSSFLINSIGQTLAKAMSEKMKENNTAVDITQMNAAKAGSVASVPANSIPEQSVWANTPLKDGTLAEKSAAKDDSTKTAKTQATEKAEFATLEKSDSGETAKTIAGRAEEHAAEAGNIIKTALSGNRPDWVDKPPRRVGDAYQMSVSTEPYSTRLECEARIPYLLQDAVNQFMEKYPGHEAAGKLKLHPDQLQQLVAAEWEEPYQSSVGMMTRIHLLLNFDQKAKDLINDALHLNIFTMRAAVTGTGLIGMWLLMAVIWGYLKLDLNTKGAYRKRLRAAAGFAILVLAMLSLVALRILA